MSGTIVPFKLEGENIVISTHLKEKNPQSWEKIGDNKVRLLHRVDQGAYDKICRRMHKSLEVWKIWQIQNPLIYAQFEDMKGNYKKWFGREPQIHEWFHGTEAKNVESIINNNFDLRYLGEKGSSYYYCGKGVYFTQDSAYANFHSLEESSGNNFRFMFLSEVLVDSIFCVPDYNTAIDGPPPRPGFEQQVSKLRAEQKEIHPRMLYDTTTREGKSEFVKFQKNEFYPTYLIMCRKKNNEQIVNACNQ